MVEGGEKLRELLGLLDLEQIEENIFRAQHPKVGRASCTAVR